MKPIQKDELYAHVSQFLRAKGVEMKDGSYPRGIQAGCSLLADAINLSQKSIKQAQAGINKNLERMREVIHEKTAPKSAAKPAATPKAASRAKPGNPRRKRATAKK
jgi:hypothetical protein